MICRTVYFSGRVQGVGFRWKAARIGQRHDVAGTVENLRDGRVKLVMEGRREVIDAMLEDLKSAMAANIQSVDSTDCDATGKLGRPLEIIR